MRPRQHRLYRGWRKAWEAAVAPGYVDEATPINPQRAAHEINGSVPEDTILVSDIGVHHNWLLQFCKPRRPDSLIGCMGFGPMGFGVAGVLDAKLATPDPPCVSVCGDGAFFMHANVLGTAVEYGIPAVWVVWNNYSYASIRGLQRGYLDGRELATDFRHSETGAPYNPDFAALARSVALREYGLIAPAIWETRSRPPSIAVSPFDRRQHRGGPQPRWRRGVGTTASWRQQSVHWRPL